MSAADRTFTTEAGPLRVAPLSEATMQAMGRLFPAMGMVTREEGELLALVLRYEDRVLSGLCTGYGWHDADQESGVRELAAHGRAMVLAAAARFRELEFDGVLLPGSHFIRYERGAFQTGEFLCAHANRPLEGGLQMEPSEAFERVLGAGTWNALMSFAGMTMEAWREAGMQGRKLTDLEPCKCDRAGLSWAADIVVAGSTIVRVAPVLNEADPVLATLVRAGVDAIEWRSCGFLPSAGDDSSSAGN